MLEDLDHDAYDKCCATFTHHRSIEKKKEKYDQSRGIHVQVYCTYAESPVRIILNSLPDIPMHRPFDSARSLYRSKHSSIAKGYGSKNDNEKKLKFSFAVHGTAKEKGNHIREPCRSQLLRRACRS